MSETLASIVDGLNIDDQVSDEHARLITELLGGRLAVELGSSPNDVLQVLRTEPGLRSAGINIVDLARKIHAYMVAMGITPPLGAAPAQPAGPMQVEVVMPTARRDMGIEQLLRELAAHPDQAAEIIALIEALPGMALLNAKLAGTGQWAIINADGTLNIDETLAYYRYLSLPGNPPMRKWRGQFWPCTIQQAVGQDERLLIYPFGTTQETLFIRQVAPPESTHLLVSF